MLTSRPLRPAAQWLLQDLQARLATEGSHVSALVVGAKQQNIRLRNRKDVSSSIS